jgi:hypothetical protein
MSWNSKGGSKNITTSQRIDKLSSKTESVFDLLLQNGVYNSSDFMNEVGIIPPYWKNGSIPFHPIETKTDSVGPCFIANTPVKWIDPIEQNTYPTSGVGLNKNDWANYCLPGFLIIGAGKCGTSVRQCRVRNSHTAELIDH